MESHGCNVVQINSGEFDKYDAELLNKALNIEEVWLLLIKARNSKAKHDIGIRGKYPKNMEERLSDLGTMEKFGFPAAIFVTGIEYRALSEASIMPDSKKS